MQKAFSDSEIKSYIPHVITYDKLKDMNIKDLKLPVVILYLTSIDHGHWTLLHRVGGEIEFFDSYGIKPDLEFKQISPEMQFPKYLAKLLSEIGKKERIHYNPYQFQAKKMGVNTCGRWCIVRNMYSEIDIDRFKKGIDYVCDNFGISMDDLVVGLT